MRFGWVTINARNLQSSTAFYTELVGMSIKRRFQPFPGTEIVFLGYQDDSTELELIHNGDGDTPQFGKDISLGFGVASLEQQIAKLEAGQMEFSGPFQPAPSIRFIYTLDPDGVKIQFFEQVAVQ